MEVKEVPGADYLVIGMPDVGLVGLIASTYLVKNLNTNVVAYVDSPYLPPVIIYHEAQPYPVMRIHSYTTQDRSFLFLVSEVAMSPSGVYSFSRKLIEWTQAKDIDRILLIGGVPTPQRMKLEKPMVYAAGVTTDDISFLEKNGLNLFREGFVSGPYAMILKECYLKSVKGVALLAESFLNYPDPGAAAAVITVLNSITGLKVNVEPLLEQEEEIRARLRETMKRTMETMRESGKAYEFTVPAMYM
ncbi:MAG: PAC2 family protein [Thermofilaceae archaeon]|nr:PAC2 family protein [Thermofilaceae archaeon]MCX8181302.1 PAC2 family protein [Thermofilaceae archaeon]MDW8004645.1 PAC2 family protein [Thermofilaceae archaeon]